MIDESVLNLNKDDLLIGGRSNGGAGVFATIRGDATVIAIIRLEDVSVATALGPDLGSGKERYSDGKVGKNISASTTNNDILDYGTNKGSGITSP